MFKNIPIRQTKNNSVTTTPIKQLTCNKMQQKNTLKKTTNGHNTQEC